MFDTERRPDTGVAATALVALLAVVLSVLYGLHRTLPGHEILYLTSVAYTAPVLFSAVRWGVPLDLVLVRTVKWAAAAVGFSALVTCSGTYAGWRLLRRRRVPKRVFA